MPEFEFEVRRPLPQKEGCVPLASLRKVFFLPCLFSPREGTAHTLTQQIMRGACTLVWCKKEIREGAARIHIYQRRGSGAHVGRSGGRFLTIAHPDGSLERKMTELRWPMLALGDNKVSGFGFRV